VFGWFKKKPPRHAGPDFSTIDSLEKAETLFRRGELEMLNLLPPQFGGSDDPHNTLFVPVGLAAVKAEIDQGIVADLVESGLISRYNASPEYQGRSFIPIAIRIVASGPGEFSTTLNIWGEALDRPPEA
jgi:hypothetical protein